MVFVVVSCLAWVVAFLFAAIIDFLKSVGVISRLSWWYFCAYTVGHLCLIPLFILGSPIYALLGAAVHFKDCVMSFSKSRAGMSWSRFVFFNHAEEFRKFKAKRLDRGGR